VLNAEQKSLSLVRKSLNGQMVKKQFREAALIVRQKRSKLLSTILSWSKKMFKAMGLNLGNFLIKKPLRWAFSQAFGSKIKPWFDENVAIAIDVAIGSGFYNPATAILKFVDGDFTNNLVAKVIQDLSIPKKYESIAKEYIKDEIKKKIEKGFSTAEN
jgi:hypothetical protein